jgi:hypothetical protein
LEYDFACDEAPHFHDLCILAFCLALACAAWSGSADKKPQQQVKPMAGPAPRPCASPGSTSRLHRLAKSVESADRPRDGGRGKERRVDARLRNTDIEEQHSDKDEPMVGEESHAAHLRLDGGQGWCRGDHAQRRPDSDGRGRQPGGGGLDPRGAANAAQSARLLYRRLVEMFPNSPLVPDAAWRAADIQWQIERPTPQPCPRRMRRIPISASRWMKTPAQGDQVLSEHQAGRRLAAFDLIDNKLCGDWQGTEQCPEKESELYLKYADEYPDGPRTARALYEAVYRQAVLTDMYAADGDDRKSTTPTTRRAAWPRN